VITVTAPGKLVVLGEYAVLEGAPALVAAVDRGVRCEVLEGDGLQTPGDDRFVRAALNGAPRRLYRFADWNPVTLPDKPGFGGSAAATVAACLAGFGPDGLLDRALRVHHAVQGSGSGIDVWASVHGGLRAWPQGNIHPKAPLSAIYSGQSAKTGPRVKRFQAWGARERRDFARASAELLGMPLIEALAAGYALLKAMSAQAGIDYDTPALARIATLAADHGGAAKPSGAGGGDVAVACIPDPEARTQFEAACALEGLPPIAVRVVGGAHAGRHQVQEG
jgi:phosphomevalonate kinase